MESVKNVELVKKANSDKKITADVMPATRSIDGARVEPLTEISLKPPLVINSLIISAHMIVLSMKSDF